MGVSQRRKGAVGERELVRVWRKHGFRCIRTALLQSNPRARAGDIEVERLPRWWIECKRQKRVDVRAAMRQAMEAKGAGYVPVVCYREDRGEWMIALPLEELLELLGADVGGTR